MRISSSQIFQIGLKTINAQQSDLLHLYQQIGTGQKMVNPSDDPLGAAQSINLSQTQSINKRFAENREVAMRNLGLEEDALDSLTLLLQDIKTRLIEAGNGSMSDADRSTLATVIGKSLESALGIANTTDGNGQYLFSGSKGDTQPFNANGKYFGDAAQRNIQADQTRQLSIGDTGLDVFQRAQPGTRAYTSFQHTQGTGSTAILSKPFISDNDAGNSNAQLFFSIEFQDDNSYRVIVTDADENELSDTTKQLDPEQKHIDLGYGTLVNIEGTPAGGDVFRIEPMAKTEINLFSLLGNLQKALAKNSQGNPQNNASLKNILNTSLQQLDSIYDNVLTVRSSIGARMNEIEALDNTGIQRDLGYTKALSVIEDLDYYEASMQLSLRSMALEGASMAFKTIQGLSLFNRG